MHADFEGSRASEMLLSFNNNKRLQDIFHTVVLAFCSLSIHLLTVERYGLMCDGNLMMEF